MWCLFIVYEGMCGAFSSFVRGCVVHFRHIILRQTNYTLDSLSRKQYSQQWMSESKINIDWENVFL